MSSFVRSSEQMTMRFASTGSRSRPSFNRLAKVFAVVQDSNCPNSCTTMGPGRSPYYGATAPILGGKCKTLWHTHSNFLARKEGVSCLDTYLIQVVGANVKYYNC